MQPVAALFLSSCLFLNVLLGCATSYIEFEGECVVQEWKLATVMLRSRQICDLPPPDLTDPEVRDREEMNPNPFPGLFDANPADSADSNLLEKRRAMKGMMEAQTPQEYAKYERLYLQLGGTLEDIEKEKKTGGAVIP